MNENKNIKDALDYASIVAENTFLTAFFNKVVELVDNSDGDNVSANALLVLIDFVKECYKNVSV